jgi:hypothetical protein
MDLREEFILEITGQIITSDLPNEAEYLPVIMEELKRQDFSTLEETNENIPLGLGLGDIGELLRTPQIIAILSSVWVNIIMPLVKEAIDKSHKSNITNEKHKQLLRKVSKDKLRKYIAIQGRKLKVEEDLINKLSDHIVDWIKRHPDDINRIS